MFDVRPHWWLMLRMVALVAFVTMTGCGDDPVGGDGGGADTSEGPDADAGSGGLDDVDDGVADVADTSPDETSSDAEPVSDLIILDAVIPPDSGSDSDAPTTIDAAFNPDLSGFFDGFADGVTDTELPFIDSVDPAFGPVTGGTFVVAFGSGFTPNTSILVGGVPASRVDVVDEFTLTFFTPAYDEAGPVDIKVLNRFGQTVAPGAFRYVAPLVVTELEPATGPERGGLPVTISGSGFEDGLSVAFGSASALDVVVVSSTEIRATVPPGTGTVDVRVSAGPQVALIQQGFVYFAEPVIDEITPAAAPTTGGITADVFGTGFTADSEVTIGGRTATVSNRSLTASRQRLRVTVPPGAAGTARVTVSGAGGSLASLADGFVYYDVNADGISGIAPASGPAGGGTRVTIGGSGFGNRANVSAVRFGGAAASITSVTENVIVVSTPAGTGVADVEVETVDETFELADAFTWIAAPTFVSITPNVGSALGGEDVTITGSGFATGTRVSIGGRAALSVAVQSATSLTAVTPPGSVGPADLRISVPRGGDVVATGAYTYDDEFTVGSLSPSRGALAGGTLVIVRGSGFASGMTVRFGEVAATSVQVVDSTTLEVRTPRAAAAGTVKVSVTRDGTTEESATRFTYFEPYRENGGWWGAPIDGAINVTVENADNGERVPNAYVTLNLRAGASQYAGFTNEVGQITFSGIGLTGPRTVSAVAPEFGGGTVTNFDAENVIVRLFPIVPPSDGEPPPPPEWPTIRGVVTGLDKTSDPNPGESLIAIVRTTAAFPGGSVPEGTGYAQVTAQPGVQRYPYEMLSREGTLAVVAICGIRNDATGDFRATFMGIVRGISMRIGEDRTVDVDCNIPMDTTVAFKFVDPPFAAGGPDINLVFPLLDLESDGGIDLLTVGEGRDTIVNVPRLVDPTNPLLGDTVSYFVVGQVDTQAGGPVSITFKDGVTDVSDLVVLEPFVPPAQFTFPASGDVLVERRAEWRHRTDAEIDFHMVFITDLTFEPLLWFTFVPGDERVATLPTLPTDLPDGYDALPSGALVLVVRSVDALEFNYDAFDDNDFSQANWRSYAENAILFENP
jgi:hypothetical protein